MAKFFSIVTKISAIATASITVKDAQAIVEELDVNDDGKLSLYDLVMKVIEKVKK